MSHDFAIDERFRRIQRLSERVLLASPTPHKEDEWRYIKDCYESGWLTTVGPNIDELEKLVGNYMSRGCTDSQQKKAVALVNGTAAIHLAVKLAAEKVYHSSSGITTPDGKGTGGSLLGRRVFVSDLTFGASVNPVLYEGGEPVFIDSKYETWNMDPDALRRAFEIYPDTRIVIFVHLYGVPGKIEEVKRVCEENDAVLIEDAAESLGAVTSIDGVERMTGSVGDFGIISFNGNKIITGSSGGMLIVDSVADYNKAKKWSTQSREAAPWYEHEELGYNYRISNIIAGIVRGQWGYLNEHIEAKKAVFERYRTGLEGLPVEIHAGGNYWLSSLLIDRNAMSPTERGSRRAVYRVESGKSSPTEVLQALDYRNAEGRPIWKPMHLQPIFRSHDFVTVDGISRGASDAYIEYDEGVAVTEDVFERGLCLPSDNKMSVEQQEIVVEVIRRCFQ